MATATPTGDSIAISGVGIVSPFGPGVEPFLRSLEKSESAVRPLALDRFPVMDWCPVRLAAIVPDFSLEELTKNPKESARAWPLFRLAWAATHLALKDAGLVPDGTPQERIGIFVGISRFIVDYLEYLMERILFGRIPEILPIRIEKVHPHGIAGQLTYLYKIVGPTLTFSSACQSGVQALEAALTYLDLNLIDHAIVISSDTISSFWFHAEAASGSLSSENDPQLAPRPYDQNAEGAVMGEGAVTLILERERDARARGANIQARIVSLDSSANTSRFATYPQETPDMALDPLFQRLDLSEIDLVYGDGRGIRRWDLAESKGIHRALGKHLDRVPVTSILGSTGHAGGTSFSFQIVAAIQSFISGVIPAIQNLEHPVLAEELDYVKGRARRSEVEEVVVLTHEQSGHHYALALRSGS
jgi:3-oxoacyl-[acyl-carrier-protein] synthase II